MPRGACWGACAATRIRPCTRCTYFTMTRTPCPQTHASHQWLPITSRQREQRSPSVRSLQHVQTHGTVGSRPQQHPTCLIHTLACERSWAPNSETHLELSFHIHPFHLHGPHFVRSLRQPSSAPPPLVPANPPPPAALQSATLLPATTIPPSHPHQDHKSCLLYTDHGGPI